MQGVLDFAESHYPKQPPQQMVEVGCGVGRWIATLAQRHPQATCWGIDYSYQMLKRAHEFWVQGRAIDIDWSHKGFPPLPPVQTQPLDNLHFGLAKAADLPFEANSQNLVVSSFVLDRLEAPLEGLRDMHRVLQPQGRLILVTPLNFEQKIHWAQCYPASKIHNLLQGLGFEVLHWEENLLLSEPLDVHGNAVTWRCLGVVGVKMT